MQDGKIVSQLQFAGAAENSAEKKEKIVTEMKQLGI